MYKLDKDGEMLPVQSYEDDNYFRLNIWSMGRARELACWGHGLESASAQLKFDMEMAQVSGTSPEQFEPSDYLKALMHVDRLLRDGDLRSHWGQSTNEVYEEEYHSFLEPFSCTGKTATIEQCEVMAGGLELAVALINSQPIVPEALSDLDIYSEFADWLRATPNGVFVG